MNRVFFSNINLFLYLILITIIISGCVPVPVPIANVGYENTRRNIPKYYSNIIIPGKTTIIDVVFALGEPDGMAIDYSWVCYGNLYNHGGASLVFVGAEFGYTSLYKYMYNRLIIPFNSNGIALDPIFESEECLRSFLEVKNKSEYSKECLDISGKDLYLKYNLSMSKK